MKTINQQLAAPTLPIYQVHYLNRSGLNVTEKTLPKADGTAFEAPEDLARQVASLENVKLRAANHSGRWFAVFVRNA